MRVRHASRLNCVVATDTLNTKIADGRVRERAEADTWLQRKSGETARAGETRRMAVWSTSNPPAGGIGRANLGRRCHDASSLFLLIPTQTRVLDTQLLFSQINSVVRSYLARRIVSNPSR